MNMTRFNPTQTGYGIGAVARLTGIPANTLRAWERRYGLVTPQRDAGNQRQYLYPDVLRLQLIKQLLDQGHAISTLAGLDETALRERLQLHRTVPAAASHEGRRPRVLIHGDALPFLVEGWRSELSALDICGATDSYAQFEEWTRVERPDVLVLEWPALDPEVPRRLSDLRARTGASRLVLVYGFAAAPLIARLEREGVVTLRAPVTAAGLRAACELGTEPAGASGAPIDLTGAPSSKVPVRRFDSKTLAAVANASTQVRCECPHQLVDLIFRLAAFEAYSADCENRNARDAVLHHHLQLVAGQARALLEGALDYLIQCEEMDVGV